jgi:hypothetical protein
MVPALGALAEARSYGELRGELTNELGRDRPAAEFAIQIVCSRPADAYAPRARLIDAREIAALPEPESPDDGIAEIALRPGF